MESAMSSGDVTAATDAPGKLYPGTLSDPDTVVRGTFRRDLQSGTMNSDIRALSASLNTFFWLGNQVFCFFTFLPSVL